MRFVVLFLLLLSGLPAFAQQSASFDLEEGVLNSGGSPTDGVAPASVSFSLSLDALGSAVAIPLSGGAYTLEGGFVAAYLPPLEVTGLDFVDIDTLSWNPERAAGSYRLYRGELASLSGLGYGSCLLANILPPTAEEASVPASGEGFFYLVTSTNRLYEEGSKGSDSNGVERPNPAACP